MLYCIFAIISNKVESQACREKIIIEFWVNNHIHVELDQQNMHSTHSIKCIGTKNELFANTSIQ